MDSKGKATKDDKEREQEQEQNPSSDNDNINNNELSDEETETNLEQQQQQGQRQDSRTRTPFANLSQVDADLALARTLQEQERAYMMLRMNNNEGSDYGSWEAGSYLHDEDDDFGGDGDDDDDDDDDESDAGDHENHECDGSDFVVDDDDEDEDAFDVHAHEEVEEDNHPSVEYDSDVFSSDEAYARALQDAEERDMAARLLALAGIHDREIEDPEDHGGHSQDTWEEVDPDELSYEELLALGEVVGSESRGLSADTLATLPTVDYKAGTSQNGSNDSCVICRLDYEDGETLTVLSCKHSYHSECINNWLKINKIVKGFASWFSLQHDRGPQVCPVCSAEVSTSGHS